MTTDRGSLAPPQDEASASSRKVIAAATVTVLLWASAFVVIRGTGTAYGPGELSLLRMSVGSLVLTVLMARRGLRLPPRALWPRLIVLGLAWFSGYNLALNQAERTIDAGTAAMLVNISPLLVVLGAGLLLREGFPRPLLVGAPVAFGGVVLIGLGSGGRGTAAGVSLGVLAALLAASSILIQKPLLAQLDGLTVTWAAAVVGTIGLLPWAPSLVSQVGSAPPAATAGVIYLGLFPTAIAFLTWAYVLTRTSAGRTSVTTYVVPALAVGLSWAWLGETPAAAAIGGGALCLVGVGMSRLRIRPRRRLVGHAAAACSTANA